MPHSKTMDDTNALFCIVAPAFVFLSAYGAVAEETGFDKGCEANTRKQRVVNLIRIGYIFLRKEGERLRQALNALERFTTLEHATNWG
jgi:hypothetical protein